MVINGVVYGAGAKYVLLIKTQKETAAAQNAGLI